MYDMNAIENEYRVELASLVAALNRASKASDNAMSCGDEEKAVTIAKASLVECKEFCAILNGAIAKLDRNLREIEMVGRVEGFGGISYKLKRD